MLSALDSRFRGNDGFEVPLMSIDGADVRVLAGMAEQESGSVCEEELIEDTHPTWRDLCPEIVSYTSSFPRKRESRVRGRVLSALDSRLRGNDGFEVPLMSIDGADVRVLAGMAEQESGSVCEEELIEDTHPTWRDLWPGSVA